MLEFTLVNHPVDCPICDKAGECTLQKLYQEWDGAPLARRLRQGRTSPRWSTSGRHIVLDAERCILCTRCIRVCDEVGARPSARDGLPRRSRAAHDRAGQAARQPLLAQHRRRLPGRRADVEGLPLHHARLGALHHAVGVRRLRHRLQHRDPPRAAARSWRLVPRQNQDVNKYWMCDEGRFTYKEVARARASPAPRIGGETAVARTRRSRFAAERLARCATPTASRVGVVLDAQATNEDNFAARARSPQALGIDARLRRRGRRRARSAPTTSCATPTSTRTPPASRAARRRARPRRRRRSSTPASAPAALARCGARRRRRCSTTRRWRRSAKLDVVVISRRTRTSLADAAHVLAAGGGVGRGRRHLHQPQGHGAAHARAPSSRRAKRGPHCELIVARRAQARRRRSSYAERRARRLQRDERGGARVRRRPSCGRERAARSSCASPDREANAHGPDPPLLHSIHRVQRHRRGAGRRARLRASVDRRRTRGAPGRWTRGSWRSSRWSLLVLAWSCRSRRSSPGWSAGSRR